MKQIVATGLNHRTAPVELREKFAVAPAEIAAALESLLAQPGVQEAVIVSTCNRVEIYSVEDAMEPESAAETGEIPCRGTASFFSEFFQVEPGQYINHLYRLYDEKAVRHLFTVAAGLDSMLVGEPQILGQVKDAFACAQTGGATGPVLNGLFNRTLAAAKRARTETGIGQNAVSVPYAAVELAKRVFDSLKGKSVALLGRGEMCEATAVHLTRAGVENVYAVNRRMDDAVDFAKKIGGVPLEYRQDLDFLMHADILVCGTRAEHPLVTREALHAVMSRRRNRLLLLVDISVPREIDPSCNELPNVYLFNVDHLEGMVTENKRVRVEEARKAASLLEQEVAAFWDWYGSLNVVPTIVAFRDHLETLREGELKRVFGEYAGWSPEQRETVEQFSRALINKIGHLPTVKLKNADDAERASHYSGILRHLFELEKKEK